MFYSLHNKEMGGYVAVNGNTIDRIVVDIQSVSKNIDYCVCFYVGENIFSTGSWYTDANERLARLAEIDINQVSEILSELFTYVFNNNQDKSIVEMISIFNNEMWNEDGMLKQLAEWAGSDY